MSTSSTTAIRLTHFSDIHITVPKLHLTVSDWVTKRSTGWFNLRYLGRGHRFRSADSALACLGAELRQRRPDHIIFSGDATALGFEEEIARAVALLGVTGSE